MEFLSQHLFIMVIELRVHGVQKKGEIIRVISKWTSAQRELDLIITSITRPKLRDTKFNYHFITLIWNRRIEIPNTRFYWFSGRFLKMPFHLILYAWCDLEMIQFRIEVMRLRPLTWCDLEQCTCNSWIYHTAESQSDFKDHQCFPTNGCNKHLNPGCWWPIR